MPKVSGIQPSSRRTSRGERTGSWPATSNCPASGRSNVASISRIVVLPDPLAPTSAVTVPGGASNDISSTATTEANVRRTERTTTPPPGPAVGDGGTVNG